MIKKIVLWIIILFTLSFSNSIFAESQIKNPLYIQFSFQAPLIWSWVTSPDAVSSFWYWVWWTAPLQARSYEANKDVFDAYWNDTGINMPDFKHWWSWYNSDYESSYWLTTITEINKFIIFSARQYNYNNYWVYNACYMGIGGFDPVSNNKFHFLESFSTTSNACISYSTVRYSTQWFRNNWQLVYKLPNWTWKTILDVCSWNVETWCQDWYTWSLVDYTWKLPAFEYIKTFRYADYFAFWNSSFYVDKINKKLVGFSYSDDPNLPELIYSQNSYDLNMTWSINSYNFTYYPGTNWDLWFYISWYDSSTDSINVVMCWTENWTSSFACRPVNTDKAVLYYNYYAWKGWQTDKYKASYDIKRVRDKMALLWINYDDWTTKRFYVKSDNALYVDNINTTDNTTIDWPQTNTWSWTTSSWTNDNSSIVNSLLDLFSTDNNSITELQNSLSWALDSWTNGFAIWSWWTSSIQFTPWNNNYWNIVNRNDNEKTCDMFNWDWSFAYYSNWSYDLSINLNWILDLWYADKVPFLEELLFIPNKILSFITNPLNNIFSTLRVFWWIWENTYCYFGTLQTIEFQKHIMVWASFFWWEIIFTPWTLTIIDYLILFFMWIPMLILTVRILLY